LLGITMPVAELERAVRQAAAMPGKLNNVLRLHFCVWTDATRAWNKRFMARHGKPADYLQAGDYSAVTHYLKAVQAAGTDEAKAVAAKMRELPINDFMTENGHIREDGRVMRNAYLVQVKSPSESTGPWDFYKILATIPPEQSIRPLDQGDCPYLRKS